MNKINTLIAKTKTFITTYKWLLIPLIPIILFIYFIIIIITLNQTKPPLSTKHSTTGVSPSPVTEISGQTQVSVAPSGQAEISTQPYGLNDEVQGIAFGKTNYLVNGSANGNSNQGNPTDDAFTEGSISQKPLSDGSIQVEFQSDDPQRPHMQIVKNGVVLFRRNLMPDDTTLDYYSGYLTNPPYSSQGSTYYGANAVILANPSSGIAVVYDPQSSRVYEQYLFQATSVADFVKKFGSDITAFNPAP